MKKISIGFLLVVFCLVVKAQKKVGVTKTFKGKSVYSEYCELVILETKKGTDYFNIIDGESELTFMDIEGEKPSIISEGLKSKLCSGGVSVKITAKSYIVLNEREFDGAILQTVIWKIIKVKEIR